MNDDKLTNLASSAQEARDGRPVALLNLALRAIGGLGAKDTLVVLLAVHLRSDPARG
jgi:hypothetical protein